MKFLPKLFRRKKLPRQKELVRPFRLRAKEALIRDDLPKAIAYLNCGIKVAPEMLSLYLQRAQIFQYGLQDYSQALQDYRFILSKDPDAPLASKCKEGMKDMMKHVSA